MPINMLLLRIMLLVLGIHALYHIGCETLMESFQQEIANLMEFFITYNDLVIMWYILYSFLASFSSLTFVLAIIQ